jgi:hypothetical protein
MATIEQLIESRDFEGLLDYTLKLESIVESHYNINRVCPVCHKKKPVWDFARRQTRGRVYFGNECARCYRKGRGSVYGIWMAMKQRCYNPKAHDYRLYGARGIRVCNRWLDSYAAFFEDMGPKPIGKSLDRKNNDGPYSPENCRWATPIEQHNNTRACRLIEFRGERLTLSQWSRKTGISCAGLKYRIDARWPIEEVLTRPSGRPSEMPHA